MKVTYRQIAKILVRGLPLDNQELPSKVDEYTKAIEAMPKQTRFALQSAYIFSSKMPPEERRDMFQEIVLAVLRKKRKDDGGVAYMTARGKWLDWLEKKSTRGRHPSSSLNEVITVGDSVGSEKGELMVGMDDLEDKVINRVEAQRLYRELPRRIKLIVKKRLRREPISHKEKSLLFNHREVLRSKNPEYRYPVVSRTRASR